MAKIVDIAGSTPQPRKPARVSDPPANESEDDLPDIDNEVFWLDPADEEPVKVMTKLPPERIAAIVVKGCFALYHLVREHRRRRTSVPEYLLRVAREHDIPLIPAAEALYVAYFEGGHWPDDIPQGLLDIGSSTADSAAECIPHALRLHRLLEAFGSSRRTVQNEFFEMFPTDEGAMLLVQVMITRHRSWMAAPKHPRPV